MIAQDPDDDGRRLFLEVKNNIGRANGLAYRLVGEGRDTHVEWDSSPVLISANDIDSGDRSTPIGEAMDWLNAKLANGSVPSKRVKKDAMDDGIAERTLQRAKKEIGVVSEKEGTSWVWRLPGHETPDPGGEHSSSSQPEWLDQGCQP